MKKFAVQLLATGLLILACTAALAAAPARQVTDGGVVVPPPVATDFEEVEGGDADNSTEGDGVAGTGLKATGSGYLILDTTGTLYHLENGTWIAYSIQMLIALGIL